MSSLTWGLFWSVLFINACCVTSILFKPFEMCFMAQNIVYLGRCSGALEKCVFCSCWVWCCINVGKSLLFDVSMSFLYLFGFFWGGSRCPTNYWGKDVEVSNYNCGFLYFSFHFYQFLLHIYCSSVVWCIYTEDFYVFSVDWLFLPLCNVPVCLW